MGQRLRLDAAPVRWPLLAMIILSSLVSDRVMGQTGPELMIQPFLPAAKRAEASGGITFGGDGSTNNASQFQLTYYESQGRVRLLPDERADPRIGYDVTYLDIDTNDPSLPSSLIDNSIAFGVGLADKDGWLIGGSVGLGYAANGAYADGNAWYGKADLGFGKKIDDNRSLGIVINYDGNRTFMPDVPLPGFEYRQRYDETLLFAVGFPYCSVEWTPTKEFTLVAKYVFPDEGNLRIDYTIIRKLGLFASYAMRNKGFHWDDLPNSSDRILFQQRRVETGVIWRPTENAVLMAAVGYAFSQEFNVGWDTRDQDELAQPSDEPYLRIGCEIRF